MENEYLNGLEAEFRNKQQEEALDEIAELHVLYYKLIEAKTGDEYVAVNMANQYLRCMFELYGSREEE